MHGSATHAASRWTTHVRNSAIALLAVASTACVDQADASDADEQAITSELTSGSGDADLYKCAYPMCGGARIEFDSRDLGLRKCTYDARARTLDCDADVADSPRIPRELWAGRAAQLTCVDGLLFSCTGTSDLQSCACTSTANGTGSGSAGGVQYGPVIKVKPKG